MVHGPVGLIHLTAKSERNIIIHYLSNLFKTLLRPKTGPSKGHFHPMLGSPRLIHNVHLERDGRGEGGYQADHQPGLSTLRHTTAAENPEVTVSLYSRLVWLLLFLLYGIIIAFG